MDGTLLPFGSRAVSERTHSAILSALDADIAFGPASGRDYADLADAFDGDARCFSTGIMANGKKVFSSGELVFKKTLSTEALVKLDSAVRPYAGTSLWLVADVDETGKRCEQFLCAVEPGDEFALEIVKDSGRDMALGDVPTNRDVITAGIFVNVSSAPTEVVRSRCKEACPELDFPSPVPFFLDVVPAGWSKVNGLDALLGSLGVTLDEVAFIGDSENDVTLLEKVPNSYAVAGAMPEAKAAAHHLIGDAAEDSVAKLIEQIVQQQARVPPAWHAPRASSSVRGALPRDDPERGHRRDADAYDERGPQDADHEVHVARHHHVVRVPEPALVSLAHDALP